MENKIYNAIQKGLTNALIFDDNDSSISYQKSNIDNETELMKVSLNELCNIFKNNPDDIFHYYDTKECLSLILENRQEISLHEYSTNCRPVFLKVSDDILKRTGNEILIAYSNNHYITPNPLPWQNYREQILPDEYLIENLLDAMNDFDGYSKCQLIKRRVKNKISLKILPAINYCDTLKSPLIGYQGYLPSVGQMNFIVKYLDMINYVFVHTGSNLLSMSACNPWWTSSEHSSNCVWYLNDKHIYYNNNKVLEYNVLPLFIDKK